MRHFLISDGGVTLCLFGIAASKGVIRSRRMKVDKCIWRIGGKAGNLKLSEKEILSVFLLPQKITHESL